MIRKNQFNHVCPRNCFSTCTMISHVENNHLSCLSTNPTHPYTKGKLCAKGYSYIEQNYHPHRLKYPCYQKVKGSGKFIKITWENAYELITSEIMNIYKHYGNFKPVALYKGTGNTGIHHYVTDEFFFGLDSSTRIIGVTSSQCSPGSSHIYGEQDKVFDPKTICDTSLIILWGTNPAVTNIHLIPYLIEAKIRGTKLVVIDPVYTKTAELADLYIQIKPNTDCFLAKQLMKDLIINHSIDQNFIENHTVRFNHIQRFISEIDKNTSLATCGISNEAYEMLFNFHLGTKTASYILGSGLQHHANGMEHIHAIEMLSAITGSSKKTGGIAILKKREERLFNNQKRFHLTELRKKHRILHFGELIDSNFLQSDKHPLNMLWITCGNPINQEPNSHLFHQFIKNIPFVITVDHFLTPTALMSNLVLPTTTIFEEHDIVTNSWHKLIALNEKAVSPYFQSRSEWAIINELASRLNKSHPNISTFSRYASEEEYLNAQFNKNVEKIYNVKSITDLKEKSKEREYLTPQYHGDNGLTKTKTFHFTFTEKDLTHDNKQRLSCTKNTPSEDYPFWLLTPHHPNRFNSQFHFLHLHENDEICIEMNPMLAKKLGIVNGEIVQIYNEQGCMEIKANYNKAVPTDILLIFQGWHPRSNVNVNKLVPYIRTNNNEIAFYNTFVNIRKLNNH